MACYLWGVATGLFIANFIRMVITNKEGGQTHCDFCKRGKENFSDILLRHIEEEKRNTKRGY